MVTGLSQSNRQNADTVDIRVTRTNVENMKVIGEVNMVTEGAICNLQVSVALCFGPSKQSGRSRCCRMRRTYRAGLHLPYVST